MLKDAKRAAAWELEVVLRDGLAGAGVGVGVVEGVGAGKAKLWLAAAALAAFST